MAKPNITFATIDYDRESMTAIGHNYLSIPFLQGSNTERQERDFMILEMVMENVNKVSPTFCGDNRYLLTILFDYEQSSIQVRIDLYVEPLPTILCARANWIKNRGKKMVEKDIFSLHEDVTYESMEKMNPENELVVIFMDATRPTTLFSEEARKHCSHIGNINNFDFLKRTGSRTYHLLMPS